MNNCLYNHKFQQGKFKHGQNFLFGSASWFFLPFLYCDLAGNKAGVTKVLQCCHLAEISLYITSPAIRAEDTVRQFTDCLSHVEAWMRASWLLLNPQKIQIIWLDFRQQLDKLSIGDVPVLSTILHPQSTVHNLSVILDSQLTISNHITNVCQSGCYQLRQLRGIVQSLTPDAFKMLIHAFITSRLDYCNSLLLGVTDQQFKRIQSPPLVW